MNAILTVGETGISNDVLGALFRSEDIELTVVAAGDSSIDLRSDISSKSHDEVPDLLEKRPHDILIAPILPQPLNSSPVPPNTMSP